MAYVVVLLIPAPRQKKTRSDAGHSMCYLAIKVFALALCVLNSSSAYIGLDRSQSKCVLAVAAERIVPAKSHRLKTRTITAGINLKSTTDLVTVESAISFLQRAKKKFENEGYEIQTLRIATQPFSEYLNGKTRSEALTDLKKIDAVVTAKGVLLSIGPVITDDRHDPEFALWATQLIKETKNINFSVAVASPERGVHSQTAVTAAEAIVAISKNSPGGEGNFRFTAAANCLAGTPFFPGAYHLGPAAFSIGLETPRLFQEAFAQ